ncbi:DUF4153 domain-containing protein [Sporolactobacillus sp. STCC-11]|uniref:DUF4153 domain-containing protein n=1 Tax=Sporolactobacillus caesalpiniae TaxID=3230362 RepID=UPI0033910749
MKLLAMLSSRLTNLNTTIMRFPITVILLVILAAMQCMAIETGHEYGNAVVTLIFAALAFSAAQVYAERYALSWWKRALPMIGASLLTILYFLLIRHDPAYSTIVMTRTSIAIFGLSIAFAWLPSLRGGHSFYANVMIIVKSVFTSLFFSAIIYGGIMLILVAVDTLLIQIGSRPYSYTGIILWTVWAPTLFLSLIPVFRANSAEIERAAKIPKFVDVLISYVLIPTAAVYSLVLLIYMIKTIVLSDWNENLLEPLILSYCIAVLMIYSLSNQLMNRFAVLFRHLAPKLLIPVALFQFASTLLVVLDQGMTHTHYLVLLFCLYAAASGVILSISSLKNKGYIAILAMVCSVIAMTPPIDAFTTSRISQTAQLQTVLERNQMIRNHQVQPNPSIDREDQETIARSISYLERIDALQRLSYLPKSFEVPTDFETTFGFSPYAKSDYQSFDIGTDHAVRISGYDHLARLSISKSGGKSDFSISRMSKDGTVYQVSFDPDGRYGAIQITDSRERVLLSAPLAPMIHHVERSKKTEGSDTVAVDQMSFEKENDKAKIKVVFQSFTIEGASDTTSFNAMVYVFTSIK